MSKTAKIISIALGGVAVVASGILVACKVIEKKKKRYPKTDSIDDVIGLDGVDCDTCCDKCCDADDDSEYAGRHCESCSDK